MKNLLKNSLKLISGGLFIAAMGFGMSSNLSLLEGRSNINLSDLFLNASASGESGFPCGTCKGGRYYCGGYVGGPCGVKYMNI